MLNHSPKRALLASAVILGGIAVSSTDILAQATTPLPMNTIATIGPPPKLIGTPPTQCVAAPVGPAKSDCLAQLQIDIANANTLGAPFSDTVIEARQFTCRTIAAAPACASK
jgi:hypothetical protein